ncbi:MAG: hypothetical protein GY722_27335 [bacterium]|nr:hypothetical protein [bacterium]
MGLQSDIENAVLEIVGGVLEPLGFSYVKSWMRFYRNLPAVRHSIGMRFLRRGSSVRIGFWLGVRVECVEELLNRSRRYDRDKSNHSLTLISDGYHLMPKELSAVEWIFSTVKQVEAQRSPIAGTLVDCFLPFVEQVSSVEDLKMLISTPRGRRYISPDQEIPVRLGVLILKKRWRECAELLHSSPPSLIPKGRREVVQGTVIGVISEFNELERALVESPWLSC